MIIKTKFNIGDEVSFEHLSSTMSGRVYAITPIIYSNSDIHIIYEIMCNGISIEKKESHLSKPNKNY